MEELNPFHSALPAVELAEEQREEEREYACLRQALGQLPNRYRTVLVLRYFEDLSYDDIAKILGKRLGTVKSLIHRGLKRLRRLLEQNATFR